MPGAMLPRLVEGFVRVFIQRMLSSRQLASLWKALSDGSSVIRTSRSLVTFGTHRDPQAVPLYPPFFLFCLGLYSLSLLPLATCITQLQSFLLTLVCPLSPSMAWPTGTCREIKPVPWLTLKGQIALAGHAGLPLSFGVALSLFSEGHLLDWKKFPPQRSPQSLLKGRRHGNKISPKAGRMDDGKVGRICSATQNGVGAPQT